MKVASLATQNILAAGQYLKFEFYEFILPNLGTFYFTDADSSLTIGGVTYLTGLTFTRTQITHALGLAVQSVDLTIVPQLDNPSGGVTISGGVVLPNAPTGLTMTGQTPNGVSLAWLASARGTNPVASYRIYRNGAVYANINALAYTDSGATGTLGPDYSGDTDPTATLPGVAYQYAVSAVDTGGNEGPAQSVLSYVAYQNGTFAWPLTNDFSFNATAVYNDTSGGPQGGVGCVKVSVTAAGGVWQPTAGGNVGQWDLQAGAFDHLTLSLKPTIANQDWKVAINSRAPAGDVFAFKNVNISAYGPITTGVWTTYSIPLADLNTGISSFTGRVVPSGTTMAIVTEAGTVNWYYATLTVTATLSGGGVDVGGFITGGGLPSGCQVNSTNQQSSIGTFIIVGPNMTASTGVIAGTTLTCQRTAVYKFALVDLSGASTNTYYADNFLFTGPQPGGISGGGGGTSIGGTSFLTACANGGFDGGVIQISKGFFNPPASGHQLDVSPGIVPWFYGLVDEIQAGRFAVDITVNDAVQILNVQMPRNILQSGCVHALFDPGCTLSKTAFTTSGSVASVTNATTLQGTGFTQGTGYFTLGVLTFTSGVLAGASYTIKSFTGPVTLTSIVPWAAMPSPGDTFTLVPGCDKSQATCTAKFGNLIHYRGAPYVPQPETLYNGVSTAATAPTLGGQGGQGAGSSASGARAVGSYTP